jgi:hypothetical protein
MSLQIVISQTAKQLYNVGLYGKYELKLLNVSYSDTLTTGGTTYNNYLIQFASDRLKLPFSADPGYNGAGGKSQRCFVMDTIQKINNIVQNPITFICNLDGVIDIELQNYATAATVAQVSFNSCVLNFDVKKLD